MKKLAFRGGLIVILLVLGVFLFVIGKEHTIFVDNLDLTLGGVTYSADSSYEVWVDGQQVGRTALAPGKRNAIAVPGPWHKIELQRIDDKEPIGGKIKHSFKVSLSAQSIVNIPALLKDAEGSVYPVK